MVNIDELKGLLNAITAKQDLAELCARQAHEMTAEFLKTLFPKTLDEPDGLPLSYETRKILINDGPCTLFLSDKFRATIMRYGKEKEYECIEDWGTGSFCDRFYLSEDGSVVVFYEPSPERGCPTNYHVFFLSDIWLSEEPVESQ